MKKVLLVVAPVLFVMMATSSTMLATGCGGGGSGGSGGGSGGGGGADGGIDVTCNASPAAETSTTIYNKLHAACDSCHSQCPSGAGCPYGDYGDATKMYNSLVNQTSLVAAGSGYQKVKPNDLAHSTAYLKCACTPITNPSCKAPDNSGIGSAMPQNGPALTADQLKALKDWICVGAPQ